MGRIKQSIIGRSKWLWRKVSGQEFHPRVQTSCAGVLHGNAAYGGYVVCPDGLSARSVVYSFGIGQDASFDCAMIAAYGAEVHAFDPTPESLAWVGDQSFPPEFHFTPCGIAAADGSATFYPNANLGNTSYSAVYRPVGPGIEVPVRRLITLMAERGHTSIDVLKMDIEGAEYEVLPDVLKSGIRPGQILVEFHHKFKHIDVRQTKAMIRLLNRHGYKVFHWKNRDFSFIRR